MWQVESWGRVGPFVDNNVSSSQQDSKCRTSSRSIRAAGWVAQLAALPVACAVRMYPRRLLSAVILAVFVIVLLFVTTLGTTPSSPVRVPSVADLSQGVKQVLALPKLPDLYSPFGPTAHKPPEQADSSNGGTKWYSDLKWLNPFSSETTLDDERALLPPLPKRQPIYTWYSPSEEPSVAEAESALLLTWRRAWYAKGFKPVVIGLAEAAKHPLFERTRKLKLDSNLQEDVYRWLAFGHMGGGILSSWLAFPMTNIDDPVLAFLHRGRFYPLLKFKELASGLICGEGHKVDAAIVDFLDSSELANARTLFDAISTDSWQNVDAESAIAYYDINFSYEEVREQAEISYASGLNMLAVLINAHLHTTWQAGFPDGIAVLKPHPERMTAVTGASLRLARDLISCPLSPIPSSCPPNIPGCKPCVGPTSGLELSTPPAFENSSTRFTIGCVPHPYTFTTVKHNRETIDVPFIRRETERDSWLNATTAELLGTVLGGPQRLVLFKEAVASPFAIAHSLWVTAERAEAMQPEWLFGFTFHERRPGSFPATRDSKAFVPSTSQLAKERMLLELAREKLQGGQQQALIDSVAAWNLADHEAWMFVQAFAVRRRTEREKWEAEESRFAGAAT